MNYQALVQNAIAFIILVLLVLCLWFGFSAGRDIARSTYTLKTVASIQQGLDYFYSDQGRYPTKAEYDNQQLMNMYLTSFPPRSFMTKNCSPHIGYSSFRQLSFALEFCLPRSRNNLIKGKNTVTEKSPVVQTE